MKHRIIDFHTHLGDIFHENKNIAFKRPGIVPHEDGFDPFKDLEESGFTRPLIVPDQKAQNVLIDAGQYRIWDRANIYTTGETVSYTHLNEIGACRICIVELKNGKLVTSCVYPVEEGM